MICGYLLSLAERKVAPSFLCVPVMETLPITGTHCTRSCLQWLITDFIRLGILMWMGLSHLTCSFANDRPLPTPPPTPSFLVLSDAADQSKWCLSFHGLFGMMHVTMRCSAPPQRPFLTFTRDFDEEENLHVKHWLNRPRGKYFIHT